MASGQPPDGAATEFRQPVRVLVGLAAGDARTKIIEVIDANGFDVCADCDVDTAADCARAERPDLALLQAERGADSVAAAREILSAEAGVAVLILDDELDDELLFAALDAGVAGVLPLDVTATRLPRILQGVLSGEAALSRRTMGRVVREFGARARATTDADDRTLLTQRQREVLELLARGMSTSEIADALFISRVTVRTHVSAILRHLAVPDRAAAVEYFGAGR